MAVGTLGRFYRRAAAAGALAAAAVWLGCTASPTAPSTDAPFSVTDLRLGTGPEAVDGSVVTVHYTGWFYDASKPDQKGVPFDSSAVRGPLTFTVGAGMVIPGWDQGIVGMKVGGLRRLVIPPSLGYGGRRQGPIPPNTTLIFELELLDVITTTTGGGQS
jgi:FKBP-type peptidyl-prolyl cis-trans isomerase FkpA